MLEQPVLIWALRAALPGKITTLDGKMKTSKTCVLCVIALVCLALFGSCKKGSENPNAFIFDKDASYGMGMYLASQFQIPDVYYDYNSLIEGFKAYNEQLPTKFTMEEGLDKINAAFEAWAAKNGYLPDNSGSSSGNSGENLEAGKLFLAENGRRPGVVTTSSGLQYEVITEGTGAKPSANNTVRVHYEGTLINGTVFDSSYARGEPIEFPLNGVIPGWTEGVQLMSEGSTYRLFIPSELGYGGYATAGIPANSALIFKVELISIVR